MSLDGIVGQATAPGDDIALVRLQRTSGIITPRCFQTLVDEDTSALICRW